MTTATRQAFTDQPVRLFVLNETRDGLEEVLLRADFTARYDRGIPYASILPEWIATVRYQGRDYRVSRRDGADHWFGSDSIPHDDDDLDDDE